MTLSPAQELERLEIDQYIHAVAAPIAIEVVAARGGGAAISHRSRVLGSEITGLCLEADPNIFFAKEDEPDKELQAKRVCRSCPLLEKCMRDTLEVRISDGGIRGGMTDIDRRNVFRRARKARAKAVQSTAA